MIFIFREKQNLQSHRVGEIIEAKNLTHAKLKAVKSQCFYGTILTLENVARDMLAYKKAGEKWINCN